MFHVKRFAAVRLGDSRMSLALRTEDSPETRETFVLAVPFSVTRALFLP